MEKTLLYITIFIFSLSGISIADNQGNETPDKKYVFLHVYYTPYKHHSIIMPDWKGCQNVIKTIRNTKSGGHIKDSTRTSWWCDYLENHESGTWFGEKVE